MSKSDRLWYARYPGDYARKTSHLSLMECGAYDLLMDWYYANEKPLPAFDGASAPVLHRICRAVAPEEQEAVQRVVQEFFVKCDDGYRLPRADEEIKKRKEISDKRRKAQEIRETKRRAKDSAKQGAKGGANGVQVHTQPQPHNIISDKDKSLSSCVNCTYPRNDGQILTWGQVTDVLWLEYPRVGRTIKGKALFRQSVENHLNKKGKTENEHRKNLTELWRAIVRFRKYCEHTGEKQPDPHRWIKNKGFEDDYSYSEAKSGRGNGYSLEAARDKALQDKTSGDAAGREKRLENLGLGSEAD